MWLTKENKNAEITSVYCTLYICNKISNRKPLVDTSHIPLFRFSFNIFCKQNINLTEVFQIFTAGFSFGSSSFLPFIDWRNQTILVYTFTCLLYILQRKSSTVSNLSLFNCKRILYRSFILPNNFLLMFKKLRQCRKKMKCNLRFNIAGA